VNMGVGEAVADRKQLESAMDELALITGQKPRLNRSRRSVAGFKVREGMPVGASVTMRGNRMWEFFDRLLAVSIPRIRDFRGLNPRSFDGRGNYTFGVTEQLIFPEIDFDRVSSVKGMDITICTSAVEDAQAKALLLAFGFPFRKQETSVR
ncbi:MAG: 50S ribosomal protein L5, partial [bacterium]